MGDKERNSYGISQEERVFKAIKKYGKRIMNDLKEMFNDDYAKLYTTFSATDIFSTYLGLKKYKYGEEAVELNRVAAEIFETFGIEVGSLITFALLLSPVPLIYYYNKKIVNSIDDPDERNFLRNFPRRVCYITLISAEYIATLNNLLFYTTHESIIHKLYLQIGDLSLAYFITTRLIPLLIGLASYFIPKLFKNLFKTK